MRIITFLAIIAVASAAIAQTPPLKPQTPDVKVPPPIDLAGPQKADPDAQGRPITAQEAVEIAMRRQPALGIARSDVRAAEGRTQQARSGLNPQLGLNGSFSEQEQIRGGTGGGGGGTTNRFTAGLNLDQLLFDFERTRDQVRQQSALERATRNALRATEGDVGLQVKQAFYNYAENLELVKVAEANVASRQRQLALADARLNEGVGAPGDLVRAKTNLADSVLSLTAARNSATNSRMTLAQLMGIDPRTPINPAPATEAVPGQDDVNALVSLALERRPEILEAKDRVIAARFGISVADKTNLPRFGLNAGISARGANDPLQSQTGTFGVSVSWTFSDGGLAAGRKREARASEEAAQARLTDTANVVVTQVSQAYIDLRSAEQRVETAQVGLANARELLRISEGRYAGGIGSFLEVTDAQSSLVAAERNVTTAVADVQRARAALARAVGT